MKLRWTACRRLPDYPLWAVALVSVWLGLVAAAVGLSAHQGRPVELCLFHRLTHLPCPTCGATRGTLAILHGHWLTGWGYNPLLFSVLAGWAALLGIRLCIGRRVQLDLSRRQRRTLLLAGLLAVCVNWLYLIFFVG